MRISTFSIVCGSSACDAKCPYCVSKMTKGFPAGSLPDWQIFQKACQLAQANNVTTALITGKGEPLLFPYLVTEYMVKMQSYKFPLIEIQTNGIKIATDLNVQSLLPVWKMLGNTLICLSILHPDCESNSFYMTGDRNRYRYLDAVDQIHKAGLKVRLNFTLTDLCVFPEALEQLLSVAQKHGVEQLTVRDVNMPQDCDNEIAQWVQAHQIKTRKWVTRLSYSKLTGSDIVTNYLKSHGAKEALPLPHGAVVYDYNGQNICVSTCLTQNTSIEDIRQLIYFPDGRLAYDWTMAGARFL
jgi:molybdenum cofactor biosynthesis enzyme MoaA